MKTVNAIVILSFLLQACGGQEPTQKDIVGKWKSVNGAEIVLNENGAFTANSFPAELLSLSKDDYKNVRFSGSGTWEINKIRSKWDQRPYEVYLYFKYTIPNNSVGGFSLELSGAGILENKLPYKKMFFYRGDPDNNERCEFLKQ